MACNCNSNVNTANPCADSSPCTKGIVNAACVKYDGTLSCGSFGANPTVATVLAGFCAAFTNLQSQITTINTNSLKQIKISLTSTQIKSLNSSPVIAIPAPGAGKVIQIVGGFEVYTAGTTPYSTAGDIVLLNSTNNNLIATDEGTPNSILTSATSANAYFVIKQVGTYGATEFVPLINAPVYIASFGTDPTLGNGTLDVYLSYLIITL